MKLDKDRERWNCNLSNLVGKGDFEVMNTVK